jgi:Ca2+-binding EF-hand superfamily protein
MDDLEDARWREIIKEVDSNGDGVVSFQEFCNAVESFIAS